MTDRTKTAENILINSGCLKSNERLLIIADDKTMEIGEFLKAFAEDKCKSVQLHRVADMKGHGDQPEDHVGNLMLESDLIACLSSFSMAHTAERKAATDNGSRFLSLPDYSWAVYDSESLTVDFNDQRDLAKRLELALSSTNEVRVKTQIGSDLTLIIENRPPNNCDAVLDKPGSLGSPPDIEVNVAPIENQTQGTLVVDGSIPFPGLGVLSDPVSLTIKDGLITEFNSKNQQVVDRLNVIYSDYPENAKILGELGFGLNPLAKLTGAMLEDEGYKGAIHCGFGSNQTIGGKNKVGFHLDYIVLKPDVFFDGKQIMNNGEFTI